MSNWLTPQHLRDASRVLAGLGAVVVNGLRDSKLLERITEVEGNASLSSTAEFLQQQAKNLLGAASVMAKVPQASSKPADSYTHVNNGVLTFGSHPLQPPLGSQSAPSAAQRSATPSPTPFEQSTGGSPPLSPQSQQIMDAATPAYTRVENGIMLFGGRPTAGPKLPLVSAIQKATQKALSTTQGQTELVTAPAASLSYAFSDAVSILSPPQLEAKTRSHQSASYQLQPFETVQRSDEPSPLLEPHDSGHAPTDSAPPRMYTRAENGVLYSGSNLAPKASIREGIAPQPHVTAMAMETLDGTPGQAAYMATPALAQSFSAFPALAQNVTSGTVELSEFSAAVMPSGPKEQQQVDKTPLMPQPHELVPPFGPSTSTPVFKQQQQQPPPQQPSLPPLSSEVGPQGRLALPRRPIGGVVTKQVQEVPPRAPLRERRVPETQFGRAIGFAGMGASLIFGNITDGLSRAWTGNPASSVLPAADITSDGKPPKVYNNYISESNAERLAAALCRMRGAALKVGQMLSIQDENVLPPQVQAALERVRAGADVMPRRQLEQVLRTELGDNWRNKVQDFDMEPRAAASIGQVHAATLHDGRKVAMKIQYPGVARSIESDVDNLMRLISFANVLPKGLFVESAVKVAKRELKLECDYTNELAAQQRFAQLLARESDLLNSGFNVPAVIPELCTARVMTSEWVDGVPIDKVRDMPQEVRDAVGARLLDLTLHELFAWRFMQTDPNWGNFLYDQATDTLHLIDFGAAREFPEDFVRRYQKMVAACAERDGLQVINKSIELGFLTGDESTTMMDAHTEAGFVAGRPFGHEGLYDFGAHDNLTGRVAELGSIMLKNRLTPPPEEAYSLHRKLSGAFLACMKLRARVPCRKQFYDMYDRTIKNLAAE